jgi:YVTN family beta-propeller protein
MKMLLAAVLIGGSLLVAQTEKVGPLPDGGFLLTSGWKIKPAGTEIPVGMFPMSSALTPDGKMLLVLNPPNVSVIEVASAKEVSRAQVPDGWLGLTMNKAGDRVYVGGGAKAAIYEFTFANGTLTPSRVFPIVAEKDRRKEDFIGDVQFSPDGRLLYAADLYRDSVVVVNPQSGLVTSRIKTGRRPYRILFHKSGRSFYVSSWADGAVGQYDTNSGALMAITRVGPHATDMVWRDGEVDGQPSIKARLFVSASNTNSVFVLGATETGDLARLETINLALSPMQPVGMTPEGMGLSSDGNRLYVACADANAVAVIDIGGERSRVAGFVPTGWYPTTAFGLPGGRLGVLNGHGPKGPGTVQLVDAPDEAKLLAWSDAVVANSPYRDEKIDAPGIPANSPVRPNGPIKHVIYIVRQGSTADETAAPNLHKIAREFVLLDNFYLNGETRAEGENWATAAIAPDYIHKRPKSDDDDEPAASPPAGYLWTNAAQARISVRNYGSFDDKLKTDVDRAKAFIADLQGFVKAGTMPQLLVMGFGDAPDNDQGIGMMVEAVSKSRFWNETAIFVVDSTTQNSSRHAPAWVISPWVKRGSVDSTMYNPASVLRTIEIILGMRPMTVFDAGARPLFNVFAETPTATPFEPAH